MLVGGVVAGSMLGVALANMLVKLLTGVFDPAPTGLSVPVVYVALLVAFTVSSGIVAGLGALRATRRKVVTTLRDL